jgi:WD40 repeat protein
MSQSAATSACQERTAEAGFVRHRGPVTCVATVPGQPFAVTAAYDGGVGIFDLRSGKADLLGYHGHLVNHIAVNSAGSRAASSSSDYEIHIWNLNSRRRELVLRGHSDDVDCFAFASDRLGVSSGQDCRVIIWDLETGAIVRIIHEHEKDVISVVCSEEMIFSSGDDKTVRQWDLSTGKLVRRWGPFEHETDTCAVDPLNGRVVAGCDDGHIRIFNTLDGSCIREISAHASGIKKIAVSPVTGDILSAAYDQRIRIWSASSFAPLAELNSLSSVWERSLNWSSDGTSVVGGTFDGTVVVWDARDGRRIGHLGTVGAAEGNCCFNEVSATSKGDAALVSDDGFVRLIRLTPSEVEITTTVEPLGGRILMNAVTLDEASGLVVTGAHNHTLHIFHRTPDSLADEIEVRLGEGPLNSIRIAHCPGFENDIFAACYSGAIVRVSADGRIGAKIRLHPGSVKALRLHPSKAVGVSCSADGSLFSWRLDGTLLESFLGHTSIVDDVDFDPGGRLIASVSRDFTVKVFDLESGRLQNSVAIGHRSPKSVCFWDEKTVLIGDYWGALIKVDLATNCCSKRQIAGNGLSSLSRTAAGVLASSYDGGVYLVSPCDLTVRNVYRAMIQRLD